MPEPKKPTAAEKLMMAEALLQQKVASGAPPSNQVQVALRSFQTAPTPQEIENVTQSLMQSGQPEAALEFKAYATQLAAPTNAQRDAAQRQFDAGAPPLPVVDQALKSFKEAPSPEQIQTLGNYLRATQGEEAGQQFETYAASLLAQKATPPPAPAPAPRQGVTTVEAPKAQPQVQQAGPEQGLVQSAKRLVADTGQGLAHLFTLGKVPAPERMKEGNNVLREAVGLEPIRDKNKERDLLNEAKKVDAR